MSDKLPTDLLVSAQIRSAALQGIPILVRHHGDNVRGVILLKIDKLDGTSLVLTQIRIDDELVWSPASGANPMPNEDAERYIESQLNMDPDMWVIEIEDRRGRHWFPGRIVTP